ncbi:MAG: hypothetical protein ACT4NY_16035 [Pseudonocardiales bacterium]
MSTIRPADWTNESGFRGEDDPIIGCFLVVAGNVPPSPAAGLGVANAAVTMPVRPVEPKVAMRLDAGGGKYGVDPN